MNVEKNIENEIFDEYKKRTGESICLADLNNRMLCDVNDPGLVILNDEVIIEAVNHLEDQAIDIKSLE